MKNPAAAYEQLNRLDGGLVSLPGTANTGSVSAIGGLIKNGKVGTDARGIGALLGGQKQSADEPQQTDAAAAANAKAKPKPVSDAAPKEAKKSKKRQAAAEPSRSPEDTARQLMQNFLGN